MHNGEKKVLSWFTKHIAIICLVVMMFLIVCLYISIGFNVDITAVSADFNSFLQPWWNEIIHHGHFHALAHQIGNYNIAYQTLLAWLTTWHISCQNALKIVGGITNFVLALLVGGFTYHLKNKQHWFDFVIPCFVTLILPSVFLNGMIWLQCDALYTLFIIGALWCFYYDHWSWGMFIYGISLAFKLQAIMLLPFIIIMYLMQRKHSVANLLLILVGFYLPNMAGLFYGRAWDAPFLIYINQSNDYHDLAINAINLNQLLRSDNVLNYQVMQPLMIIITILIFAIVVIFLINYHFNFKQNYISLAAWVMWTCYLFLPAMHERYDFSIGILLLIASCISIKYLPVFMSLMVIDSIVYCNYLFNTGENAAVLSLLMIIIYSIDTYLLFGKAIKNNLMQLDE